MEGQHGYLAAMPARRWRRDWRQGAGSWRPAEENAAVEIWLTIHGATAVCGLRLSDRTMRHRTYKLEHRPASLRPTIAAAMVRLAEFVRATSSSIRCAAPARCWPNAWQPASKSAADVLRCGAAISISAPSAPPPSTCAASVRPCWRAGTPRRLPLAAAAVDRIVSNPPFGKQLSSPEAVGPLYHAMLREYDRVLRPGGLAVLLVSAAAALRSAARAVGWKAQRQVSLRVLGQPAVVTVWRKPGS